MAQSLSSLAARSWDTSSGKVFPPPGNLPSYIHVCTYSTEVIYTQTEAPMTPMTPITQPEIDRQVFTLYDEYCHGRMDRRDFLARAAALGAGALATAYGLMPNYARAQMVSFTDQR